MDSTEIIDKAISEGRSKLLEDEAYDLLSLYGVAVPDHCIARNIEELGSCANKVRYPHVLKVMSPDIVHKSDVGGVIVGVKNIDEDIDAYKRIVESVNKKAPGSRVTGVLVQHMVPQGLEVIVGGIRDRFFDTVVMFGLGGILVEVLRDVSFRVSPLTYNDAIEMLDDIQARKVLYGVRGMPPRDRNALAKIIYGVYQLMDKHRNIKEIDLNPVMSYERGACVADARVIIG
ncbi:MAG: acetate--CoA ligase family protein [Desulfurococcales archaeon]|nr:acetate--CoA ligase family protein [Desulfurococcales archaeon]